MSPLKNSVWFDRYRMAHNGNPFVTHTCAMFMSACSARPYQCAGGTYVIFSSYHRACHGNGPYPCLNAHFISMALCNKCGLKMFQRVTCIVCLAKPEENIHAKNVVALLPFLTRRFSRFAKGMEVGFPWRAVHGGKSSRG